MKVLQKNKKRAVVTGGCGFIGGYVVRELLKNGYHVIVIDILIQGEQSTLPDEVDFVHADICDYDTVKDIIQEGEIIFHLAALTSVPGSIDRPFTYYTTNVTGTQTVLEAARVQKAGGVVFSSSAAVYGSQEGILDEAKIPKPESSYALHKYFGEELCYSYTTLYGLSTICLRYFNVYGHGNHEEGSYAPVTARFLKSKREGSPLHITGDGSQTRDFIHVKDVARANALAASLLTNRKDYFECINICTGIPSRIIDIAIMIGGERIYLPARTEIKHSLGSKLRFDVLLNGETLIPLETGLQEIQLAMP